MRELFVEKVIDTTEDFLDNNQRIKLKEILTEICLNYQIKSIEQTEKQKILKNNTDILNKFISSKEIEGCSTRTLNYYKDNIIKMLDTINLPIDEITTEILRNYLADYKSNSKAGMVTIDNIRRTLSSFFTWLENEDYIVKSPVRRIHKVKTTRRVKETFTDENLEKLRDTCSNVRDLATMTIPNMEAFLNMIYSHLDLKNRSKQDLSTQDLRFLQKIKSLIVSNSNLGKNLRNPNFTDENTIFFDEQNSKVLQNQLHSIAPTLKNDTSLINTHLIFQRAYSPDEPIYIRDSNGKIYELSKHPKRKYDWNNISINSHSNFAYIPYLRSCGISENIISKLQNISTGISTYSIPKETYFPQVNMQPLQVGNSLESYFSKLNTSNER